MGQSVMKFHPIKKSVVKLFNKFEDPYRGTPPKEFFYRVSFFCVCIG